METRMAYKTITGTFLDEITHDNASQNWREREWTLEFDPAPRRRALVQPYVSKVITFEFSHFMSPNSMWPSARMLYQRYREFVAYRRTHAEPKTGTTP
jgi:hypothetical protein